LGVERRGKLRALDDTWNHRLKAEIDQPDEKDLDRRR
jgi:hypothetical protein